MAAGSDQARAELPTMARRGGREQSAVGPKNSRQIASRDARWLPRSPLTLWPRRMSLTIPGPWIKAAILSLLDPETPDVESQPLQVLAVDANGRPTVLSDKTHQVDCLCEDATVEEAMAKFAGIPSLKGVVITPINFTLVQRTSGVPVLHVTKFKLVGATGCDPFGNPRDVNQDQEVRQAVKAMRELWGMAGPDEDGDPAESQVAQLFQEQSASQVEEQDNHIGNFIELLRELDMDAIRKKGVNAQRQIGWEVSDSKGVAQSQLTQAGLATQQPSDGDDNKRGSAQDEEDDEDDDEDEDGAMGTPERAKGGVAGQSQADQVAAFYGGSQDQNQASGESMILSSQVPLHYSPDDEDEDDEDEGAEDNRVFASAAQKASSKFDPYSPPLTRSSAASRGRLLVPESQPSHSSAVATAPPDKLPPTPPRRASRPPVSLTQFSQVAVVEADSDQEDADARDDERQRRLIEQQQRQYNIEQQASSSRPGARSRKRKARGNVTPSRRSGKNDGPVSKGVRRRTDRGGALQSLPFRGTFEDYRLGKLPKSMPKDQLETLRKARAERRSRVLDYARKSMWAELKARRKRSSKPRMSTPARWQNLMRRD